MIELSDEELASRLRNFEDPYVERKTAKDIKDCLKTAVGFANTLPNGVPGVLFIPARDDGSIQPDVDLDQLQKDISRRLNDAYPPVPYFQRIFVINSQQVLAVMIWGSPERPHFAGPSYVRDGSQTIKASAAQFANLVARRSSKVEELSKWVGKTVTIQYLSGDRVGPRFENMLAAVLLECNQWYATVQLQNRQARGYDKESIALGRIEITFDHDHQRVSIDVRR
jgi:hypothetical protein